MTHKCVYEYVEYQKYVHCYILQMVVNTSL
jgi:hypothetical protein